MDIELETYVDAVMDQQNHRNGIFANVMETIIHAIADYRATPILIGPMIAKPLNLPIDEAT